MTAGSRRERPAKRAITRQWIVAETIAIMDAEGLEQATMRRVALALDTGPASLYAYVSGTAQLHALVLDELLSRLTEPRAGDWSSRLRRTLRDYRRLLQAHPGLARSAVLQPSEGPGTERLVGRLSALLREGGADAQDERVGARALLTLATAIAVRRDEDDDGEWAIRLMIAGIAVGPPAAG